jgi:hypothetical protein
MFEGRSETDEMNLGRVDGYEQNSSGDKAVKKYVYVYVHVLEEVLSKIVEEEKNVVWILVEKYAKAQVTPFFLFEK